MRQLLAQFTSIRVMLPVGRVSALLAFLFVSAGMDEGIRGMCIG